MSGPRFLPSGNRLDPYSRRRRAASVASKPLSLLVLNWLTTSSAVMACQRGASLADVIFEAAFIRIGPRFVSLLVLCPTTEWHVEAEGFRGLEVYVGRFTTRPCYRWKRHGDQYEPSLQSHPSRSRSA